MKQKPVSEPSDPNFFSNLAYLIDLSGHLNMLNLKLQGPKQIIMMMYDSVKSLMCKRLLCATQHASVTLTHFTTL